MMTDYLYKTVPFEHQSKSFLMSRDREAFALLMEQGTGKSKVALDTSCYLYANGKIDAVLIIAPNGVNRNWILNECPAHIPDYINHKTAWYSSNPSKKEEKAISDTLGFLGLKIIAMNIESLATIKGVTFTKNFLMSFRSMLILDESSTIKNPKALRTKNLLKLSIHAKYRRILTGTPVTQGPLDLFTQFSFLDGQILRTQSYYAFRNRYAIMREIRTAGRSFMTVVGYTNVDELTRLIAPHSFRVTKAECLDLPDKLYSKRYVTLSPNQSRLYSQLKKQIVAEFNGMVMTTPLALTKLLRLQQIVGGFFVPDQQLVIEDADEETVQGTLGFENRKLKPEPIDAVNPRIESLLDLLGEIDGKIIIWARFRSEIGRICERIRTDFKDVSCVEYHGGIDNTTRSNNVQRFQNDPKCKFFVGNVQAGGKGLNLHAASTVIYYSNDFSLENRLQSEDRAHRIGQRNHVTYIDLIASDTLDVKIVDVLRSKKSIADLITGDESLENWL
jgi:SNF2 family DNA or RNA helicase